jgi:hypothetical protein
MKTIRFEILESDEVARREVIRETWQPSRDILILAGDSRVEIARQKQAR